MSPTNKPILKYALINSVLTSLYVALVGSFFHFVPVIFGGKEKPDTILAPIAMLLLFLVSASICGSLVLGRPALWYLDGKKKEGVTLFLYTLGALCIILVLVFLILFIVG